MKLKYQLRRRQIREDQEALLSELKQLDYEGQVVNSFSELRTRFLQRILLSLDRYSWPLKLDNKVREAALQIVTDEKAKEEFINLLSKGRQKTLSKALTEKREKLVFTWLTELSPKIAEKYLTDNEWQKLLGAFRLELHIYDDNAPMTESITQIYTNWEGTKRRKLMKCEVRLAIPIANNERAEKLGDIVLSNPNLS